MIIISLPLDRAVEIFGLYDAFDRPADQHLLPAQATRVLQKIRGQGGDIVVAEVNGKFVGTYSIHICQNLARNGRPFGVIEHVVCLAEYRRQGIGRALMEHAILYAKEHDCYKVCLQTGQARRENHAFYEACGSKGDKRGYQVRFDA